MSKDITETGGATFPLSLVDTKLLNGSEIGFLRDNQKNFEKRFRTRQIFRSKFEMEASVLMDDEHPTPDSKYWQAIKEQNVQLQELIHLFYHEAKLLADREILEAELDELEDTLARISGKAEPFKVKKIRAFVKKKRVEIEENKFSFILNEKVAKERFREIREWEDIVQKLIPELKHGADDFGACHPERYLKRYEEKVKKIHFLGDANKLNIMQNYESFKKHVKELDE